MNIDILKNRSIWITGSARGLGLEIAKLFTQLQATVFFGSRYTKDYYIEKGVFDQSFLENNSNLHYIQCDVSSHNSIIEAYKRIELISPKLDILINNAGIIEYGSILKITESQMNKLFQTNFYGSIYAAQAVIPQMKESLSGAIINIISVTASKAFPNIGIYSATKSAQASAFKSIREELRKYGIKIVNLYPGAMASEIWDEKVLSEKGELMLSTPNAALAVLKVAELCLIDDLMIEEMTFRPQKGDL